MARALAIVGMVMVHIGPVRTVGGGVAGAAYRAPHGRAAILFIVLAGIGVSLLAGDRSAERLDRASLQLGWRVLVLLPAGLALQELDVDVAVILQYYAVYFVVAVGLMRLSDRSLLVLAAASALLGPVMIILLTRTIPSWFVGGVPAWYDVDRIARDIVISGYYPLVVWTAPLSVGVWLGRRDLRSDAAAARLVGAGAVAAALGFVATAALTSVLGTAASSVDWRQLAMIRPHNEMPLWVLTATGIAVAVIGLSLVAASRLPRLTWPLVALGQLALTAYVVHLLVLHLWPQWLEQQAYGAAWLSVARFTLVALVLATAYRAVATRGPLELLLRPSELLRSQRDPADDDGDPEHVSGRPPGA